MSKKIEIHPLCDLLPPMAADEFKGLCDDIANHGLLEPIVLYEGKILDGRNRWAATMKVGRKPTFVTYGGSLTAAEYVIAKNINRRHLDAGQRAAIAAKIYQYHAEHGLPIIESSAGAVGVSRQPTQAAAAKAVGASVRSTERAVRVAEKSPAAIDAVVAGKMTLRQAEASIADPPSPPEKPVEILDRAGKVIENPVLIPILTETDTDELIKALDDIGRKIRKLRDTTRGRHIPQSAEIDIRNAREAIKFAQPFSTCPMCKLGDGKICRVCGNAGGHTKPPNCGWVHRGVYENCVPKALKL